MGLPKQAQNLNWRTECGTPPSAVQFQIRLSTNQTKQERVGKHFHEVLNNGCAPLSSSPDLHSLHAVDSDRRHHDPTTLTCRSLKQQTLGTSYTINTKDPATSSHRFRPSFNSPQSNRWSLTGKYFHRVASIIFAMPRLGLPCTSIS